MFTSQVWSLDKYIESICAHAILSHEETIDLIKTAQADWYPQPADPKRLRRGKKARDRIIACNMKFALKIVTKYRQGYPIEDLLGTAAIALDRAIETFDCNRNLKFLTHAGWRIRGEIQRDRQKHSHTIALPVWLQERRETIRSIVREAAVEGQRLSFAEIDKRLQERCRKAKDGQVQAIFAASVTAATRSLDASLYDGDDRTLGDFAAIDHTTQPMSWLLAADEIQYLRSLLERACTPRQRECLELRYGLVGEEPLSLQEIGSRLGLSAANASRYCCNAMRALRRHIKKHHQEEERSA